MKPRIYTSVMLFLSAYSPLFLILMVKDYNFKDNCLGHPLVIIIITFLVVLSVLLTFFIFSKISRGGLPARVTGVKYRSVDLINYTIPYLLAFFGVDLSKPADIISLSLFLLILMLLTIKSRLIFINPILTLFGYGLFDLEYIHKEKKFHKIAITKLEIHQDDEIFIKYLTNHIVFIVKKVEDENGIKD